MCCCLIVVSGPLISYCVSLEQNVGSLGDLVLVFFDRAELRRVVSLFHLKLVFLQFPGLLEILRLLPFFSYLLPEPLADHIPLGDAGLERRCSACVDFGPVLERFLAVDERLGT